jgi:hypothetical protein
LDLPYFAIFGNITEAELPFALRLFNIVLALDDDLIVIRNFIQGIGEIPFYN